MPTSVEALSIFLVLLPGFLCARIVQGLSVRPTQTEMDKVVEALLYSFVIYVIYRVTVGPIQQAPAGRHLLILASYSVLLGTFVAAALTNDWPGRVLRRCRITNRTSNSSIWNDVFHNLTGYVLVELADGRLISGWVLYYSDRDDTPSLFLEDAAWIDPATEEQKAINGPGILIGRESGIRTISFLNAETENSVSSKNI
jgi:hypothetical protein